jgi:hypothetical protein
MGSLIAFPILLILIILQTTFARQVTLIHGSVDLLIVWLAAWGIQSRVSSVWLWTITAILIVSFASAMPWYVIAIGYLSVAVFSRIIVKRFWQSPLLGLFAIVIMCSIIIYLSSYFVLFLQGANLPWGATLRDVIIPSILLNLLFSLPIYVIAKDTAQWAYPQKVTE